MMKKIRTLGRQVQQRLTARSPGFTLLEVLVVLVIVGLLAGLVGPRVLGRLDKSKVTAAETQIRLLKSALETLRLDIGRFPTKEEGLKLLVTGPDSGRLADRWEGPYLDSDTIPLDPWGFDYQYDVRSDDATRIILYSFGADGQAGGEKLNADVGILPPSAS